MNKFELSEILRMLAEKDLSEGAALEDHPCIIAIKALNRCFDDIETLRAVARKLPSTQSKKVQVLISSTYDPNF